MTNFSHKKIYIICTTVCVCVFDRVNVGITTLYIKLQGNLSWSKGTIYNYNEMFLNLLFLLRIRHTTWQRILVAMIYCFCWLYVVEIIEFLLIYFSALTVLGSSTIVEYEQASVTSHFLLFPRTKHVRE